MPQSLVKNYIHITFATKYRRKTIDKEIREELFKYLGGICNNLECYPIIVGGYDDHVHIFCLLSSKIPLMKLIEKLKSHSSKWIKTKGRKYLDFYWQRGYAAFSVEQSREDILKRYIENQENHHRKLLFQEEYLDFLKDHSLEYDERFLWD